MLDLEEINFDDFVNWVSENLIEPKTFGTLAQKIPFRALYNKREKSITIVNSKEKSYTLKYIDIRIIFERWKTLPQSARYLTKSYGLSHWGACPHRDAPAIAAIIRYWDERRL